MNTYSIADVNKVHELQHIKTIVHNNNTYPTQTKANTNHAERTTTRKQTKNGSPLHTLP